jgi:L-rhamnose-H+ transport protein
MTLASVLVGLIGIAICARAGVLKDRELSTAQRQGSVTKFNLAPGIRLSGLSGVMSACMAFGIAAGKPIAESAIRHGTASIYQNTPLFAVLLLAGFTTNAGWCLSLMIRGRGEREPDLLSMPQTVMNVFYCGLQVSPAWHK